MANLIQRIEKVRKSGEAYKNSNIFKNKRDKIEKVFLPEFQELCVKFNNLCTDYEKIKVICDANIPIELLKDYIRILMEKVEREDYDRSAISKLKLCIENSHKDMALVWKEYIERKTAAITEILNLLDSFIGNMPEKKQLDAKANVFKTARIGAPNAVNAIEEYIILYNDLMNKLELKDSVLEFLKLFSTGKNITLRDMDSEVYDWIKKSDFSDKINLSISLKRI